MNEGHLKILEESYVTFPNMDISKGPWTMHLRVRLHSRIHNQYLLANYRRGGLLCLVVRKYNRQPDCFFFTSLKQKYLCPLMKLKNVLLHIRRHPICFAAKNLSSLFSQKKKEQRTFLLFFYFRVPPFSIVKIFQYIFPKVKNKEISHCRIAHRFIHFWEIFRPPGAYLDLLFTYFLSYLFCQNANISKYTLRVI